MAALSKGPMKSGKAEMSQLTARQVTSSDLCADQSPIQRKRQLEEQLCCCCCQVPDAASCASDTGYLHYPAIVEVFTLHQGRRQHPGRSRKLLPTAVDSTRMTNSGPTAVKVQLLPQGLPCGSEVTIHISTDTPLLEVKRQLQLVTGIAVQHQKVILSGINQIVLGDKRTMKFAHCGTASSFYFAVAGKKEQGTTA